MTTQPLSLFQIRTDSEEQLQHEAARALEAKDWQRFIFLRPPEWWLPLLETHAPAMPDAVFWSLLFRIYSSYDTTAWARVHFERLFQDARPGRHAAMSLASHELFDSLPDELPVRRGYAGPHWRGLSWTLSRGVAKFFALRAWERSCDAGTPLRPAIVCGTVSKSDIVTIITAFDEYEIVVSPDHVRARRRRVIRSPQRGYSLY